MWEILPIKLSRLMFLALKLIHAELTTGDGFWFGLGVLEEVGFSRQDFFE